MATFTIRDVTDEAAQAIRERAAAAGLNTEAYIRSWIEQQRDAPIARERYTLRAYNENGAHAHIRRTKEGITGRWLNNANQDQANAYKRAIELITRNAPGDREQAIMLLAQHFDDVFEI